MEEWKEKKNCLQIILFKLGPNFGEKVILSPQNAIIFIYVSRNFSG